MASTIFSGLNRSFSFLFSWRALFYTAFTTVILVVWPSILFCLLWELWNKCCLVSTPKSSISMAANIAWIALGYLPLLTDISTSWPHNWVKLSESGEDKHYPLATTLKLGSLRFCVNWCFRAWLASPPRILACQLQFFTPALAAHLQTYPWSLRLSETGYKIHYQGTESLTGLKCEAQMINQSLKGLFTLGGQAQIIFNLKLSMLRCIIFHQLGSFLLGQVTFQNMYPGVFEPWLEHKVGIRGITSFKFSHLGLSQFFKLYGCCLKALAKVFFKYLFATLGD